MYTFLNPEHYKLLNNKVSIFIIQQFFYFFSLFRLPTTTMASKK